MRIQNCIFTLLSNDITRYGDISPNCLREILKSSELNIPTSEYPLGNVTQLSNLISLGAENAFPFGILNNTYD